MRGKAKKNDLNISRNTGVYMKKKSIDELHIECDQLRLENSTLTGNWFAYTNDARTP